MFKKLTIFAVVVASCLAFGAVSSAYAQTLAQDAYGGEAGQIQSGSGGSGGGGGSVPVTTSSGNGTLPFTGFQVGIALLMGAGLAVAGAGIHRAARRQTA